MKFRPHTSATVLVLLATLIGGCSSTDSENTAISPDGPFNLTEDQAQQVIKAAIDDGWPNVETTEAGSHDAGLSFLVWNRADRDLVTAEAIQLGNNQYGFKVLHDGSAPDDGKDASKKLSELLGRTADSISK